jgi:hypothetical protein
MSKKSYNAEELLYELYQAGFPFLNEYPWEFEGDRWAELVICSLVVEVGIDATTARDSVETLMRLGMTAVGGLASATPDQEAFLKRIFIQHGFQEDEAGKASKVVISLAAAVARSWNGYLQRFLRQHGERMASELSTVLKTAGFGDHAAEKTAVLWLQNVANIPILLPRDQYIKDFCSEHQLSQQKLLDTADRLGLNVAVLDDLLALEATAGEEAPKRKQKPKRKLKTAAAKAAGR